MQCIHIMQSDLNDDADILRATKELIKKANFVLNIFSCADVSIKCKLLKVTVFLCMVALYGIYQVLLLILLILLIIKFYVNYGVSLVILIVELFTVLLKLLV